MDVFEAEKSTDRCESNERGQLRRVKTFVLLAVILFLTAAQTLHHHAKFQLFSGNLQLTNVSDAPRASAQHSGNQDECLICQLKGQYSSVHIFYAPNVTFSPEVKLVRAAVFFTAEFYRSTENSPTGGRAPPAPFLS